MAHVKSHYTPNEIVSHFCFKTPTPRSAASSNELVGFSGRRRLNVFCSLFSRAPQDHRIRRPLIAPLSFYLRRMVSSISVVSGSTMTAKKPWTASARGRHADFRQAADMAEPEKERSLPGRGKMIIIVFGIVLFARKSRYCRRHACRSMKGARERLNAPESGEGDHAYSFVRRCRSIICFQSPEK